LQEGVADAMTLEKCNDTCNDIAAVQRHLQRHAKNAMTRATTLQLCNEMGGKCNDIGRKCNDSLQRHDRSETTPEMA
jgi:hypothetical protein